jgi:hypothetical protein
VQLLSNISRQIILCVGILAIYLCASCTRHQPTFSQDVAPIIYKHCSGCHRPNQIGHFDLLTYADVQKRAKTILYCVQHKLMPPWPADRSYRLFADDNTLSEDQIKLITTWVNNNCPIGDSSKVPAPPRFETRSMLGKPDYTIAVPPRSIEGNYKDQFLLVKVPFELPQETYVHTIEFVPGNTKVVHHVNADIVKYTDGLKQNVFDGEWTQNNPDDSTVKQLYIRMGLLHDDGSYPTLRRNALNYLPGVIQPVMPDGIGDIKLNKKNAFLLSDLHYGPYFINTSDSSYINLFYSKTAPEREVLEFQLGTLGISPVMPALVLPADKITTVSSKYVVPQDISIITINPHMHLLGKSFWGFATAPNGDTIPLIRIPRWDFNWQNFYKPINPIVLKKGTTIYAVGVYDNTAQNPHNPNKPPKEVTDRAGTMRTTDEMFQFIISYMLYKQGDENIKL